MSTLVRSTALSAAFLGCTVAYSDDAFVVVTIENPAPANGTFQTPVWVGFHDGSFDSYDGGTLASALPLPGSDALERIAEDGDAGPLSLDFDTVVDDGVQAVIGSNGPIPPLAPGQQVSRLFELDPNAHRYFSYVSMVIPSNDAFIANGSPFAREIFSSSGAFVGQAFGVAGGAVNDAGTELNDEVPANTAFLAQAGPNIGVPTSEPIAAHPGFLPGGTILSDTMFSGADFLAPGYEMLRVSFTKINPRRARFAAGLDASQEVTDKPVDSDGFGFSNLRLRNGDTVRLFIIAVGLTGPVQGAHLHLAPAGQNGPVVVDLSDSVVNVGAVTLVKAQVRAEDIIGPLADRDEPFSGLIAEMVGGGIYINLHTATFPGGEIRGQVQLID